MKFLFPVSVLVLFCFSLTGFAQEDRPVTLAPASAGKVLSGKPEPELLRDPFWPIGFFPPNWQRKADVQGQVDQNDAGGWMAASAGLRVSGTSRLGDRTAAVINGELKSVGEKIEVLHNGKMYQWEIIGIGAGGQIQLKKIGIR